MEYVVSWNFQSRSASERDGDADLLMNQETHGNALMEGKDISFLFSLSG